MNFGVVYIPLVNSKYASDDPYSELQREILRYCPNSKQIILLGDFNSRSGEKTDYVFIDELISDQCGLDELVDENNAIVELFSANNVPLHRVNADKVVNTYGAQMIEFCKATNLFILNGRFGDNVQSNKVAKIRNRYNQVPHLTQDTNGKVTNSQKTPQTRAKRSALSQQVTTKHI